MNNNKLLIIKISLLVIVVSCLIVLLFTLLKDNKEEPYSIEDEKIKVNMLQLGEIAESFKGDYGYYSETTRSNVNFCELKEGSFAGKGNGHILCSNMVNILPGSILINISNSSYCIQKEISFERQWCMDSNGYFGLSSNCNNNNYRCD